MVQKTVMTFALFSASLFIVAIIIPATGAPVSGDWQQFQTSGLPTPSSLKLTDNIKSPPPLIIELKTPLDGQYLEAGETVRLNWISTGGVAPLKVTLEYSVDGRAGDFYTIDHDLPANGTYDWSVPPQPSWDCFLQATVTDGAGSRHQVQSPNGFYIIVSAKIGLIRGRVIDQANNSIAGATVELSLEGSVQASMQTGTNGTYYFVAVPQAYTLETSCKGYLVNSTGVIVPGFGEGALVMDVKLTAEGHFTPTVVMGIVVFALIIMSSMLVFYHIHRTRFRSHRKKITSKARTDEELGIENAEKYWDGDSHELTMDGKRTGGMIGKKSQYAPALPGKSSSGKGETAPENEIPGVTWSRPRKDIPQDAAKPSTKDQEPVSYRSKKNKKEEDTVEDMKTGRNKGATDK